MILRSDRFDTTPGATGECAVLAPPGDFAGDADGYTNWLRSQYDHDPLIRQVLAVAALHSDNPRHPTITYVGPFADALQTSIMRLRVWLRSKPATNVSTRRFRDDDDVYERLSELQHVEEEDAPEELVLA